LRAGLIASPTRPRTLSGCRFVPWRDRLLVLRELAASEPAVGLEPGTRVTWDQRFAVALAASAPHGFAVGYLGRDGVAVRSDGLNRPGPGGLPRLVHPVLPAIRDAEGIVAVPYLDYRRDGVGPLPCVVFRPATPLPHAAFTVV